MFYAKYDSRTGRCVRCLASPHDNSDDFRYAPFESESDEAVAAFCRGYNMRAAEALNDDDGWIIAGHNPGMTKTDRDALISHFVTKDAVYLTSFTDANIDLNVTASGDKTLWYIRINDVIYIVYLDDSGLIMSIMPFI